MKLNKQIMSSNEIIRAKSTNVPRVLIQHANTTPEQTSLRRRSIYLVYPPPVNYDPAPPPRIDPYFNSKHSKTMLAETSDASYYIHERTNLMLRKEYDRFHNHWSSYYYGNKRDKEDYRKYIREGLKQQMMDKLKKKKEEWLIKSAEAREIQDDCEKYFHDKSVGDQQKRAFLLTFRDMNKKIMEENERIRKVEKQNEIEADREQLKFNPINWRHTLK
ncbi:unnamed protein product [Heterobilharzia americana]|nr:unnamed protein product [Heterobilharzia americana]CAH8490496.1 unnamed protein product [Heterobilharzia americana]